MRKTLVAAGLQLRCRHGDRPDAADKQLVNVESIRTAGIGKAELSVKLPADPRRHSCCQRVEALSGHVHLFAWQLTGLYKGDIVIAHFIQYGACRFIPQQGRIALDKGMQSLFRDEIARNALNLLRRAAVERGKGNRA